MKELQSKMEQIEERIGHLEDKGQKVNILEKELRKKIEQYSDKQRELNE